MSEKYGQSIQIDVVGGGFILTYPVQAAEVSGTQTVEVWETAREVFVSPRKLNQKLKEVISTISVVADDEEK